MIAEKKESKAKELRLLSVYTYARYLHSNNICPRNHDIDYHNGWFYFDGECVRHPELRQEAIDLFNQGYYARYRYEGMSDIITLYDSDDNPVR